MEQDQEHLKLLRIFQLIYGILHFPVALVPIIHVSLGFAMIFAPDEMTSSSGEPPPAVIGVMFAAIGILVIVLIASIGVMNVIAASSMKRYSRHTFCLIVAGLNCINAPLGTALGVFTILVLQRPSVKELFLGPPMR
jgi:hypothetical protein